MIRLGSLVGLPAALDGRMAGRVEQAVLTPDGRALGGLVIRRGMGTARWAPSASILVLGNVSVILSRPPVRLPQEAGFLLSGVKDTGGLDLGRVTDAYIHPGSFRTEALEISLGLWEEMTCGRMLARHFAVQPAVDGAAQVIIPCGCSLEKLH